MTTNLQVFTKKKKKEFLNEFCVRLQTKFHLTYFWSWKPKLVIKEFENFLTQAIQEAFLLGADVHKIGQHGAVGFLTKKGRICTECGLPIKEKRGKNETK
jgi:hypothetical protein